MSEAHQERSPKPAIAVLSTDAAYLEIMHEFLDSAGYQPQVCREWQAAYDLICREQPALVVLDLWLEQPAVGEMFVGMLRFNPRTRNIPVIACSTDIRSFREQLDALQDERQLVLLKPFRLDELLGMIKRLTQEGNR